MKHTWARVRLFSAQRVEHAIGVVLVMVMAMSALMLVSTDRPAEAVAERCPVSATVFLDNGVCFRRVPRPTSGPCPAGTTLDPDGALCREPVDLVAETVTDEPACPDGFAVNPELAGICSRVDPAPQSDPLCPRGSVGSAGACYRAMPLYECPEGVLSGDVCAIGIGLASRGPSFCPVSDTVISDGDQCFTLVDEVGGSCSDATVPNPGGGCRRPVDLRPGDQFCESGGLINGKCYLYPPADRLDCPAGQGDQFGLCRQPVADRQGGLFCVGVAQQREGDTCTGRSVPSSEAPATFCPIGFVEYSAAASTCVHASAPIELPPGCPEGARGIAGGCYVLIVKNPPSEAGCTLGVLVDATCVALGPPPLVTAEGLTCVEGYLPTAGRCLRFTEPGYVPPTCRRGSVELLDGSCRRPVANARGARYCENPVATLARDFCIIVVPSLATDGSVCPVGFEADAEGCAITEPALATDPVCADSTLGTAGNCFFYRRPSADPAAVCAAGFKSGNECFVTGEPLTTQLVCPTSATVFEEDGDCFTLVTAVQAADGTFSCPSGLLPHPNGFECRRLISRQIGAASCTTDFFLNGTRCLRVVSPEPSGALCTTTPPEVVDNSCWFSTVDARGVHYCEDPTALLNAPWESERTCTTTADFSTSCTGEEALAGSCGRPKPACPDGYSPDDSLGGLCARTEPGSLGPDGEPVCAGDSFYFRFSDPDKPLCAVTTAFVAPCNPMEDACGTRTVMVCPLSETVMADDDECYRAVGFACPEGSTPDPDPTLCRQPVDLALLVNFISQNSAGVLGANNDNDKIGSALAEGDFNGDGYADVALGAPGEANGAGGVVVLYGSASGLLESEGNFVDQSGGTSGLESGDQYGAALASGDFNGDGVDDLAVGAPGETVGGQARAGSVTVLYGIRRGTFSAPFAFDGNASFSPGAAELNDEFGKALLGADLNGDGRDELIVGVPGEALGTKSEAGAVIVFYGSPAGIQRSGAKWLSGDSRGVPGVGEKDDRFGSALAAGDFDGNDTIDLAVGVPGEALGTKADAGAVIIFDGTDKGIVTSGAQWLSGDSRGAPGAGEAGDEFGSALVAGKFNEDKAADLVVGIPGEALGRKNNAGAAIVFYGSPTGVRSSGATWLSGDSRGVPGIGESGDRFGAALTIGDLDGNGTTDLAVGAPGEALGRKARAGAVIVFNGSGSGVTTSGAMLVSGDSRPLPGEGEADDKFASALAAGRFDGRGAGLVVGVPGEDLGAATATGAVIELPHQYRN